MAKFQTVDEYIAAQPEAARGVLDRVRKAIRRALPRAEESISYNMPAYRIAGKAVIYFAGWKTHYSVYPATREIVEELGSELEPYEVEKGTIRFPFSERVPVQLIARIARLRGLPAGRR